MAIQAIHTDDVSGVVDLSSKEDSGIAASLDAALKTQIDANTALDVARQAAIDANEVVDAAQQVQIDELPSKIYHDMTHAEMLESPVEVVIAFVKDDDENRGWWYRDPITGWEKDEAAPPSSTYQTLFFPVIGDGALTSFNIDHGFSVISDFYVRLQSSIEKRGVNIIKGAGTTLDVGPFAVAPADAATYELVVTGKV